MNPTHTEKLSPLSRWQAAGSSAEPLTLYPALCKVAVRPHELCSHGKERKKKKFGKNTNAGVCTIRPHPHLQILNAVKWTETHFLSVKSYFQRWFKRIQKSLLCWTDLYFRFNDRKKHLWRKLAVTKCRSHKCDYELHCKIYVWLLGIASTVNLHSGA